MKRDKSEVLEFWHYASCKKEFDELLIMYDQGKRVEAIKGWIELARTTHDDDILERTNTVINKCVSDIIAKKREDIGMAVADELFEYNPSSHHIIMLKGAKCFYNGDFRDALKHFQVLIEEGYSLKDMHNYQIRTYCKLFDRYNESHGDTAAAGEVIVEAVKKYPHDRDILFRYAGYMGIMKNFELALECLEKILHSEPNNTKIKKCKAFIYTKYGEMLLIQGEFEKADECYTQAVSLGMFYPHIAALYADYCLLKDNHGRALDHAKRALKMDAENEKATEVMFKIYDKVGFSMWPSSNRSVASFNPLADHIKEFKSVIAKYIAAKFKNNELEKISSIITDYLKVHTDDVEIKSIFVQLMFKKIRIDIMHSQFTTAQSNIDLLKSFDCNNAILHKMRGDLHEARHEYDKMIDSYVSYMQLQSFYDVDDVTLKLLESAKQHQELRSVIYSKIALMQYITLPENATLHMNDADFSLLFSNLRNSTSPLSLDVKCELNLTTFTSFCIFLKSSNMHGLRIVVPHFDHTDSFALLVMAVQMNNTISTLNITMDRRPSDSLISDLKEEITSGELKELTLSYIHEGHKTSLEFGACH